jgi:recombination protein RecT
MAGTQGLEVSVGKLLEQYKSQFESALPKHMRIEHFMRCAMTYIKKNPTVGKCTAVSICKSLMDAAQLGLAPDGLLGSAYLVPFNNKVKDEGGGEHWEMTCQLIPGYRGLIDLARRSGQILDIQARPVLTGEDFNLDWGRPQPLRHQPDLDANPAEDMGKNVRGVYAIAFYRDGSQHIEYMSRAEIEGIQRRSKANGKGFSPWQSDWVEMARKTVVKRLAKYLPLSPELARAIEIDNDAGEIIKDADVITPLPEEKPVSKTDALKNRLAHKPITPVQDQLDEAAEKRENAEEAAANAEADRAAARAKLEAPAGRQSNGNGHAPVKEAKAEPKADKPVEPDVLTRDEKVFVRMLGKKQCLAKVGEMNDTDMEDARNAAMADIDDPQATREEKAHAMGVIVLLEAEAARRTGAPAK